MGTSEQIPRGWRIPNPGAPARVDLLRGSLGDTTAYQNHFGLMVTRSTPVEITKTSNLLAAGTQETSDLNLSERGDLMLASMDAMEPVQVVQVVQSVPKAIPSQKYTVCNSVNISGEGSYFTFPLYDAIQHMPLKDSPKTVGANVLNSALVTILKQPKYGKLEVTFYGSAYTYRPYKIDSIDDYEDDFTLQVVYKGKAFILNYRIMNIVDSADRYNDCTQPPFAKEKTSLFPSQTTDDLDSWFQNAQLSALLSTATTALTGFADLPGLATAQTTGTQITLDSNAAGYGWYLDATPLDNTDNYLPTADPTLQSQI